MPKVFDAFTFMNENDVLSIRLEELYPVVDQFIIVQSNETFRGNKKPDMFDWDRHRKYEDKINLITLDEFPEFAGNDAAWQREFYQRNQLNKYLHGSPDDLFILSDVDEIPRRKTIENISNSLLPIRLQTIKFSCGINIISPELPSMVVVTTVAHALTLEPQELRFLKIDNVIENAGWEFSSLGTPEQVLYKLKNFAHSELDDGTLTLEAVTNRMSAGTDIAGRGWQNQRVEIDDTWPEAIKNNREYWRKLEWPLA